MREAVFFCCRDRCLIGPGGCRGGYPGRVHAARGGRDSRPGCATGAWAGPAGAAVAVGARPAVARQPVGEPAAAWVAQPGAGRGAAWDGGWAGVPQAVAGECGERADARQEGAPPVDAQRAAAVPSSDPVAIGSAGRSRPSCLAPSGNPARVGAGGAPRAAAAGSRSGCRPRFRGAHGRWIRRERPRTRPARLRQSGPCPGGRLARGRKGTTWQCSLENRPKAGGSHNAL